MPISVKGGLFSTNHPKAGIYEPDGSLIPIYATALNMRDGMVKLRLTPNRISDMSDADIDQRLTALAQHIFPGAEVTVGYPCMASNKNGRRSVEFKCPMEDLPDYFSRRHEAADGGFTALKND